MENLNWSGHLILIFYFLLKHGRIACFPGSAAEVERWTALIISFRDTDRVTHAFLFENRWGFKGGKKKIGGCTPNAEETWNINEVRKHR